MTLTQQAKQLIDQGRTAEAVQLLERRLAGAPGDHLARNMLGFAHFQAGDYLAAEAVYRAMVAVPNPDPRDFRSLGQTLMRQGKTGEAQIWLAAADPGSVQATAPAAPQMTQRPFPSTELAVPTEEELPEFTRRLRARARNDWWTENWYRVPWPVRVVQYGLLSLIVAFVLYGFLTFPA